MRHVLATTISAAALAAIAAGYGWSPNSEIDGISAVGSVLLTAVLGAGVGLVIGIVAVPINWVLKLVR